MFVCCDCCVLCRQRPLQRADHSFGGVLLSVYVCVFGCVIVCDLETTKIMLPSPDLGYCAKENEKKISRCLFNLSVQRLATGWTVRGSNPVRGEIFCTRPDRPRVPPSHTHTLCSGSTAVVKWPWHDVGHPPTCSAEVKERVGPYIYSASGGLQWHVLG